MFPSGYSVRHKSSNATLKQNSKSRQVSNSEGLRLSTFLAGARRHNRWRKPERQVGMKARWQINIYTERQRDRYAVRQGVRHKGWHGVKKTGSQKVRIKGRVGKEDKEAARERERDTDSHLDRYPPSLMNHGFLMVAICLHTHKMSTHFSEVSHMQLFA